MVRLFSLHVHDDANVVDVYVICISTFACVCILMSLLQDRVLSTPNNVANNLPVLYSRCAMLLVTHFKKN